MATIVGSAAGGLTYPALRIVGGNGSTVSISSGTTLYSLEVVNGNTTVLYAGGLTIENEVLMRGTVGNLITLGSNSAGVQRSFIKSTGVVVCDYLSISDSNAQGGGTFYAGANSTNGGNNAGWIFTAPPASRSGLSLLNVGS